MGSGILCRSAAACNLYPAAPAKKRVLDSRRDLGFSDTHGVGRSNYMILGMGVAACLALALMMQHMLKVKQTHDIPPVVSELTQMFGSRFSKSCEFRVVERPGGKLGEVTVFPLMSSSRTRIARTVGDYVWRRFEDAEFDAIIVVCDDGLGRRNRYFVPSPKKIGRRMRELREGELVLNTPASPH